MGPKRSAIKAKPAVRFRAKSPCGSNGKPVHKRRGRGPGKRTAAGRQTVQKKANAKRGAAHRLDVKERMAGLRSLFRFCSKTYGLTYSDAAGVESKEALHVHLQTLLGVHH